MNALRGNERCPGSSSNWSRLRISFHDQCRTCTSVRYADAMTDGETEGLVCSLDKPQESDDLTLRER
jgi:hypothetical protein